jgi:hypothetical protein
MTVRLKGLKCIDSKGFVVVSTLERRLNRRVSLTASGTYALAGRTVASAEKPKDPVRSVGTVKTDE